MKKSRIIISAMMASVLLFTGCTFDLGTTGTTNPDTVLSPDEVKDDTTEADNKGNQDGENEGDSQNDKTDVENDENDDSTKKPSTEVVVSKNPGQQNAAGKNYSFSEYVEAGYMSFALGDGVVIEVLDTDMYDGSEEWYYISLDMDKDGFDEMFVEVATDVPGFADDGVSGDLWFVDDSYSRRFETENYEEYLKEACYYDYGNQIRVIINFYASATNMDGYLFEIKDNLIQYPFLTPGQKFFNPTGTIDIIVEGYSANKTVEDDIELWLGHTWIPHAYKFEADAWTPLETVEITEAEAAEDAKFVKTDLIPEDEEIVSLMKREDQVLIVITEKKSEDGTSYDYKTYFLGVALDSWAVAESYVGIY